MSAVAPHAVPVSPLSGSVTAPRVEAAIASLAVKIGAARHEQAQLARQRPVARLGRRVVIRMSHFDRVETGLREPRQDVIALRETPGWATDASPFARCTTSITSSGDAPSPRNVRGPAEFQEAPERVVARLHVAGGEQRGGDLRPADAPPACGGRENRCGIDRAAERGQPVAHRQNASDAIRTLASRGTRAAPATRIDEVAEHVQVAPVGDGADLDARHELAGPTDVPRPARPRDAGGRVVIGDADDGQARGVRARTSSVGVRLPSEAVVWR